MGIKDLLKAVEQGDAERLRRLLAKEDARGCEEILRTTPLMAAAKRGWVEGVELLLPASDPAARNFEGLNALMCAAQSGRVECARALATQSEAGAVVKVYRWTALIMAAKCGSEEIVGLLLPLSDAEAEDLNGFDALTHAALNGREGCVRALLPKGGERGAARARNALLAAVAQGQRGCVEALLPACALGPEKLREIAVGAVGWRPGVPETVELLLSWALGQEALAEGERIGEAAGPATGARVPARRV